MYKPYHDWGSRQDRPQKSSLSSDQKSGVVSAASCECALLNDWRLLVHPLVLCPPIARGERYLLVQRTWWGQRNVLKTGRAWSRHESLNLARVRHDAARLGATEVHILPT
jgi:hypothetical protein